MGLLKRPSAASTFTLVAWVRERVEHGYLELAKVATTDNVADVLTKIITGGHYQTKAHIG
jgi:hypothetical protein